MPIYKDLFKFLEKIVKHVKGNDKLGEHSFKRRTKEDAKIQNVIPIATNDVDEINLEIAFQEVVAKQLKCWHCQKIGHSLKECPEQLTEEQRKEIVKKHFDTFKKKAYSGVKKKFGFAKDHKLKRQAIKERVHRLAVNYANAMSKGSDSGSISDSSSEETTADSEDSVSCCSLSVQKLDPMKEHSEDIDEEVQLNKIETKTVNEKVVPSQWRDDMWDKVIPPDRVLTQRKAAIFPTSEVEKGLAIRINTNYLGDCGCLGINLGGKELIDEIISKNLPFAFKEIDDLLKVKCAWKDYARITHIIKTTISCATVHSFPLVVEDVFIHILDEPLGKIFLGTRFCAQIGIKTVNEQIDDIAKQQHDNDNGIGMSCKAIDGFAEDPRSVEAALNGFVLENYPDDDEETNTHCIVTNINTVEKHTESVNNASDLTNYYINLIKEVVKKSSS